MKKFLYEKATSDTIENNELIRLQYFLLEDEIEIDSNLIKCYGFEIKKTSISNSVELSEIKQIPNIFFNRHEATTLLRRIAKGKVTPIGLASILEDYMSAAIHSKKRLPMLV